MQHRENKKTVSKRSTLSIDQIATGGQDAGARGKRNQGEAEGAANGSETHNSQGGSRQRRMHVIKEVKIKEGNCQVSVTSRLQRNEGAKKSSLSQSN